MHSANSASLVLTDPYTADDPLLLKPFQNRLSVHYCPINPNVTFSELNQVINKLQPSRIISPYHSNIEESEDDYLSQGENKQPKMANLAHIQVDYEDCVLEKICKGQTLNIDESELGTLKYRGKFPTSIASLIKMQAAEGSL
jgi:hypothetical protein